MADSTQGRGSKPPRLPSTHDPDRIFPPVPNGLRSHYWPIWDWWPQLGNLGWEHQGFIHLPDTTSNMYPPGGGPPPFAYPPMMTDVRGLPWGRPVVSPYPDAALPPNTAWPFPPTDVMNAVLHDPRAPGLGPSILNDFIVALQQLAPPRQSYAPVEPRIDLAPPPANEKQLYDQLTAYAQQIAAIGAQQALEAKGGGFTDIGPGDQGPGPVDENQTLNAPADSPTDPEAAYQNLPPGWVIYEDGSIGPPPDAPPAASLLASPGHAGFRLGY